MAKIKIMIVEDERIAVEDIKRNLQNFGYTVSSIVSSGKDALKKAEEDNPDLVLMDIVLKGKMDGIKAAEQILARFNIPVIYLTAYSDERTLQKAKITGPFGYIVKPFKDRELQIAIEITLYKHKMDNALKESEERYRSLYESNKDGIAGWDMEGRILECNQAFVDMLGYTKKEINKLTYQQLTSQKWHKMEADIVRNQITARGNSDEYEKEYIKKDGTIFPVSARVWLRKDEKGKPIGMWGIVRDITERKKLQEQLIQSEKLSAVGQLAAGVAHEFNNLLAIIRGNAQLSLTEDLNDEVKKSLHVIEKTTKRGKDLVKNLSAFARPKDPKFITEDIIEVIDEVIRLQKRQLFLENIKVEKEYIKHSNVFLDWGQMEQVFLNLLMNAVHAIHPKGEGTISISVRDVNNHVCIKLSDTGIGMDEKTRIKVFEPFFSTKGSYAKNKLGIPGTGLGLSITHAIVEQHNGTITVESEKDKGTTFIITLPAAETELIEKNISGARISEADIKKTKDLRILVVDDEDDMVDLIRSIFMRYDHKNVIIEKNAKHALTVFKRFKPDVVFLDIVMPVMNGDRVFNEIKSINPKVHVVFMTGKVGLEKDEFIKNGAYDYIEKPFDVDKIFDILNKIVREKKKIKQLRIKK